MLGGLRVPDNFIVSLEVTSGKNKVTDLIVPVSCLYFIPGVSEMADNQSVLRIVVKKILYLQQTVRKYIVNH